ncbi:DHA2 family efflux MFS transporter permease subunit [Pinisolibacter sp.]|uniref:DHA2 family efflux MFS transporter permease subunit n=1 Tax=Pinisolibacter sp. TaxID=2172024 RepID=UPI002FDE6F99
MTARLSRTVPLVVASALFMEHLDSTVIATSLPAMAADLGLSPIRLNLAITTYLVTMAVFIPASGWFADRLGARRVFTGAIAVFLAGSITCGAAPSLEMLVFGRALQGLGGAMMTPVGRLVMLRSVPKSQMIAAMAWLTIPALIGPVVGPPLGGFITTYASWRWIFWINVPIGLIGIAASLALMPHIREEATGPFDAVGFLVSALGLAALVFALETAGRDLVAPSAVWAAFAVGVALLALYVRHARRIARPLIDLELLRLPTFRAGVLGGSLFRLGVGALPFLLPLQLQIGFGRTPLQSGLTTFVAAIGAITMKLTAGRIITHFGFRDTLTVNAVIAGAMLAVVSLVDAATSVALLMAMLLVGGFFRSLEFTALNVVVYSDVDDARMSRATSFSSMMQQLSLSAGVALGALTLHLLSVAGGHPPGASEFSTAIALVGGLSMAAAFVFARLPADAGAAMLEKVGGARAEG